jgi:hypothetical protein
LNCCPSQHLALWRGKEVAVKVLSNVNLEAQIEEFKKEFRVIFV